MPGTALNNLHEFINFKLKTAPLHRFYYYIHFTDETIEVR